MIKRAIANVVCVSLLLSPFSATAGTYRATGLSLRTSVFFFAALSAYSPALNMGAHIDASYRLEEMVPLPPLHPDFGRTNGTTFFSFLINVCCDCSQFLQHSRDDQTVFWARHILPKTSQLFTNDNP